MPRPPQTETGLHKPELLNMLSADFCPSKPLQNQMSETDVTLTHGERTPPHASLSNMSRFSILHVNTTPPLKNFMSFAAHSSAQTSSQQRFRAPHGQIRPKALLSCQTAATHTHTHENSEVIVM